MAEVSRSRVEKAYVALQKYIDGQKNSNAGAKPLFDDEVDLPREPVFISVHATKYFADTKKLRPIVVSVPHSIYPEDVRVCLVAQDPEKDSIAALIAENEEEFKVPELKKIVGISKFVKGEFRPYEARRALIKEFDVFVCDQAVFQLVPQLLGKAFYKKNRVPVPVRARAGDKKVDADKFANEVSRVLGSVLVTPSAGPNLTIQVGNRSQSAKEIADNVLAVVKALEDKGLLNAKTRLRNIHLKATDTPALPVYVAEALGADQDVAADSEQDVGSKRKRADKEDATQDGPRLSRLERLLADVVDEETLQEFVESRKNKKAKKTATTKSGDAEAAADDSDEEEFSDSEPSDDE